MPRFDALIFDCDGVLVDSEVIAIQCEREMLASWGLHYEFENFVKRNVEIPVMQADKAMDEVLELIVQAP